MSAIVALALIGVSLLAMLLIYIAMVRLIPAALEEEPENHDEGQPV